ncbi:hypothetical protein AB0N51_12050, partial [Streptomyces sp. NPDC052507]|uniref:hypothetical protein n=1 Tax=Streptomyces sp. NPDC052507 TaxID=3161008 RepID=UPI0034271317
MRQESEGLGTGPTVGSSPQSTPDRDEGRRALFSPGEAACPPDAASPDLSVGGELWPRTTTVVRVLIRVMADSKREIERKYEATTETRLPD